MQPVLATSMRCGRQPFPIGASTRPAPAGNRQRLEEDDPYLLSVRSEWNESLRRAVKALPGPEWLKGF